MQFVFAHQETGNNWTFVRDEEIRTLFKKNKVSFKEFPTNGVVRGLKNRDEWSKIRNSRMYDDIYETPKQLIDLNGITTDQIPGKKNKFLKNKSAGITQKGGRIEGLKILNSFLDERSKNYLKNLSKPEYSIESSSRLSPFLSNGVISVKEIINEYRKRKEDHFKTGNLKGLKRNISAFNSRLSWRCHFIQKLEDQPQIEFKSMHPAYEGIRDEFINELYFKSWKEGRTGFPIIDACMRSLIHTGWLPFRMRAMLVSFASYNLLIDWKRSGAYLAKLFTDFEPGIHYSQMQMQSGVTGINAIRIYNPIKQSYDQDQEGTFIRKWVNELKNVHSAYIHEPWKMNKDFEETEKMLTQLKSYSEPSSVKIMIAPSFTQLYQSVQSLKSTNFYVAAQNIGIAESGAYTGEVSPKMLKGIGVNTVIIGHSERRNIFQENDNFLTKKIKIAIESDVEVIFCLGEKLEDNITFMGKGIEDKVKSAIVNGCLLYTSPRPRD